MSAPISVIIPTLNAAEEVDATLNALIPGLQENLIKEVIIVDGGSTDTTILRAFNWGSRIIASAKGRGRQLRTGGLNATGEWLLFLHADTQLSPDWPEFLDQHMRDHPDKAAAFRLRYRSNLRQARWLESRANRRSVWFGLPYGDQGLFISKEIYDALGGYQDLPLMEDVNLVRRIGKNGLRLLNCDALTSAEKYERDGWRKRAWSNAFLLLRYFLGASPEMLARRYT